MNDAVINTGIIVTYVLLGIAALSAILFSIYHLILNFRKAKGGLIGGLGLVAILFLGYLIATNEVYEGFAVSPTQSQWIGGGIHATFMLIGLAFLAAVFTEVSKFFR